MSIEHLRHQEVNELQNRIRTAERELERLEKSLESLRSSESIQDTRFKTQQFHTNQKKINETKDSIEKLHERLQNVQEGFLDTELFQKNFEINQKAKEDLERKERKVQSELQYKKNQQEILSKHYASERQLNHSEHSSERDMQKAYEYWSKIKFPDLSDWPRNRGKIIHPRYANSRFTCTTYCYGTKEMKGGDEYPHILFENIGNGVERKHVIYPDRIEYYIKKEEVHKGPQQNKKNPKTEWVFESTKKRIKFT